MNRKILCMTYREHLTAPAVNTEPCAGDCYAYDDVLKIQGEGWTADTLRHVLGQLIQMHAGLCGNDEFRLGIDLDEETGTYVGSFLHFGALETCCGSTIVQTVERLSEITRRYFASPAHQAALAVSPGKGRGACAYGEDRALAAWMLRASGAAPELFGGSFEGAVDALVNSTRGLLSQPTLFAV